MYYTRNYIRLNIFETIVVSVYPFCEKGLMLISVRPDNSEYVVAARASNTRKTRALSGSMDVNYHYYVFEQ